MGTITNHEFYEWLEEQSSFIEENAYFHDEELFYEGEDYELDFYGGDTEMDKLLVAPCVIVEGDLKVKEIEADYETGMLVVTGDLYCDDFSFSMDTVIGGNLYAKTVNIDSGSDNGLYVEGSIIAEESVIENGHFIVVGNKITAPVIISNINGVQVSGKELENKKVYHDEV